MFGRAVAERAAVVTGDYPNDPAFRTRRDRPGRRGPGHPSMVVAPLVAGDEVFGASARSRSARTPSMPRRSRLVRALAEHAAARWPTPASSRSSTARARSSTARRPPAPSRRRAGAPRDRRPHHSPARPGRDPPGGRRAGEPAGRRRGRDPRPARSRDRQPALGLRRRAGSSLNAEERPCSGSRSVRAPPASPSSRTA